MRTILTAALALFSVVYLRAQSHEKNDSLKAQNSYWNATLLIRNGQYLEALDTLHIAAALRENLYTKQSVEYGNVQNLIGICYKSLGNYNKALEHFLMAEDALLADKAHTGNEIARIYNNIGNVYKSKIEYGTAHEYFLSASKVYAHNKAANIENVADVLYNIADILYLQQDYNKSLSIIAEYADVAYPDTKLLFLSLKAAIHQETQNIEDASKSYQDAIRYAHNIFSEFDINLLFEYINYATFLIGEGKFSEARAMIKNAEDILRINGLYDGYAHSLYLTTKGYLFENLNIESNDMEMFRKLKASNLNEAINQYNQSLLSLGFNIAKVSTLENNFIPTTSLTESLTIIKQIAATYTKIAELHSPGETNGGLDEIRKALEHYQILTDLIQQARKEIYSDENKIRLSELEEDTFYKIIQTAWHARNKLPDDEDVIDFAFLTSERMKASVVFDRLSDQLAMENSLIPDSLTERERSLNYSITMLNEKLFNLQREIMPDEKEISTTDSLLFLLKKQREELNNYLESNFSEYYEMKYSKSMEGIDAIQQKLKNDEVVIEYVLDETNDIPELYAFLISPEHSAFYKLPDDSSFNIYFEVTHQFISNPAYLYTRNDHSKAYCIAAHNLYKTLIQPFEQEIENKKVIIIPDGKLNYLPFEALLTAMPDTTGTIRFNKLPYLIRENSINYSYSANLLYNSPKKHKHTKKRLLAFAPEYNSDTVNFRNEQLVLVPLPGVKREVDLIAQEIKSTVYKGMDATEFHFREESEEYDILHLAMHAFINDSMPAFSRFALTQNASSDPYNDGWLNTADIYNLNLNAKLTVLSACNTGRGNLRKGEGVISLARGFLYAGCPSIVMSLWEVEDNAGTEIMHSFYRLLKKGRSVDEALRQAKLYYLEEANPRLAHPHYWLGYVSIGDSAPLFRSYDFYFLGLILIVAISLVADQMVHSRKSGKRRQ